MSLLVPWLVFPLALGGLSLGCGLLLERVSSVRLPTALLLPCGFAVLALAAQMLTASSATARFAAAAVVVLAATGFALSYRTLRRHVDLWALAAAAVVFVGYGAPILLSGQATWAGYIKLDDNSTLLALTDRAMEHGRSVAGLPISTYFRTLDTLLVHGYPLATFMPLGVGAELLRTDAAWLYQPCMAFMAAMLALSLYQLSARLTIPSWLRAFAALVAAQAALLYGYALWGGIKELGTTWAVPLLAALVPHAVRGTRLRNLIPLATVSALLIGVLNVGAAVWIAPALLVTAVLIFRDRGFVDTLRAAGAFCGFLAVLSLPAIIVVPDFLHSNIVSFDPLTSLVKPLSPLQLAGIWPVGDFRFDPERLGPTRVLVAVALGAAVAGVIWAVRRGAWELPLFVVGAVGSALVLDAASTPWIAGKAFATAAPAIPLAALACAALLLRTGRPVEGAVLAVLVTGGVLWSNVLQYHDAWLAPRSQLAELEPIGERFAGDGPALMTEYQPYGVRHFLRDLDPEGASELRVRPVLLRTGQPVERGHSANLDAFSLDAILTYRTLVLRRSPVESRPPSSYQLVASGHWYEVWQRPESPDRQILEHYSLGDDLQPGAVPRCADVLRLARLAGPNGVLATVDRAPAIVVDLSTTSVPRGWGVDEFGRLIPAGSGTVETAVDVTTPGRYGIWLGGSYRDRLEAKVDGSGVAVVRNHLEHYGQYTPLGEIELAPGRHRISLEYARPDWRPGSSGSQLEMGPLALGRTTADVPVRYVSPAEARTLCGKRLDWIEALSS
jgi:hypothetical protein